MILGIDDAFLFFFCSSSHTCRQVLYNFSSCAKSAWILTASQRNEQTNEEWRRNCDRAMMSAPRTVSACSQPALPALASFLPACLPAIHLSIHLLSLSLFRSTFFRLLERHFYFMPCETFKCQAATVGVGAGGKGAGKRGRRCLLMHTCGLVLSPFYILDEKMRKLSFACVSILEIVNHMLLLPALTPSMPRPPP